ncbi:MAG: molybdopterin molybdotransferase MoeA [Dehalococcoidales bacterium]|nr:molybdopterin molybdotransferase MoeA [Dehalococcoidales bacterium]
MERENNEIDEGKGYVGYREAFEIISRHTHPVGEEETALGEAAGRIAAVDIIAHVSYPTVDVSLKDGFAVKSSDIAEASAKNPVRLKVIGSAFAGSGLSGEVTHGSAIKVCSGAPVPPGTEAVVSIELTEQPSPDEVLVFADASPGRNILRAGSEVARGDVIAARGARLMPGYLGLIAAAGLSRVKVFRRPRVAIIGVGDEVIAPGQPLAPGQLYASNLITMQAWLTLFGITSRFSVARDDEEAIRKAILAHIGDADVVLTSGGAWGSERDLVLGVLEKLGWQRLFQRVRMGPGKGISFGFLETKPVFCLPGGPASNEMAFIQLALPGILKLGGDSRHPLPTVLARLTEDVPGRHRDWTEFKDAVISRDEEGCFSVSLFRHRSRLQAIARANSLICVPEGRLSLHRGETVPVQLLIHRIDEVGEAVSP